jgi:hypothetical protein
MSQLSCPDCTVLSVLPHLILSKFSCPGCPILAVLSLLSCSGHTLFSVLSRLTWTGCPVQLNCLYWPAPAILSWLSCPTCPIMAFLSRLSCLSCPVPAVLSCHVHPGLSSLSCNCVTIAVPTVLFSCCFLVVLSWLSCPAVLSWLSCPWLSFPGCPVPDVLSQMSWPRCPVSDALSKIFCPGRHGLSLQGCPAKTDIKN